MAQTEVYRMRGVDAAEDLELGPDVTSSWDDAWLDDDGELSAAPGWAVWGSGGDQPPAGQLTLFPTTDDPRRYIEPPSRLAKPRAERAWP
jgi:hypothetical protein